MTFAGFPARAQMTPIPNVFFSDVLPRLASDALTAGVVLYAFGALQRRRGFPRYVTPADVAAEPGIDLFLANAAAPNGAVEQALRRAVDAGVLLSLHVEDGDHAADLFFLNAPADRRGLEAARAGAIDAGRIVRRDPVPLQPRPTIFSLYESLVGTLSPLIADELTEAERLYPRDWLERAFREAAAQNARSWRYVSRILERWAAEGPDHETTDGDPAGDARYFSGKYGGILKRRLQQR